MKLKFLINFFKVDYIIHLEADLNLILKRLKLRRRGFVPKNRETLIMKISKL